MPELHLSLRMDSKPLLVAGLGAFAGAVVAWLIVKQHKLQERLDELKKTVEDGPLR